MMNLLVNTRPSFNGAADGTSYTSALSNGRSGRSMPTFVLGATSFNSFEVLSMEQLVLSRAKPMMQGFYLDFGVVPSQSNTLYRHFVEIYSAFKQDIWALYTTKWGKAPFRVYCWGSNYWYVYLPTLCHCHVWQQKNPTQEVENELAQKHAVEEEEHAEAAKNQKWSIKVVVCVGKFLLIWHKYR
jgi:hypothetical protein